MSYLSTLGTFCPSQKRDSKPQPHSLYFRARLQLLQLKHIGDRKYYNFKNASIPESCSNPVIPPQYHNRGLLGKPRVQACGNELSPLTRKSRLESLSMKFLSWVTLTTCEMAEQTHWEPNCNLGRGKEIWRQKGQQGAVSRSGHWEY